MTRLKSVSLVVAKAAAIAVALLTLGCFVWNAQTSANPPPPEHEPGPMAADTPNEPPPSATRREEPAGSTPSFLPSSKSLVIEMPAAPAQQREPTMMFSSKSAVLIEPTPEPTPLRNPTLIFGSKSAVLIEPTPEPTPQVFLPSSKSGRPIPQQQVQGQRQR